MVFPFWICREQFSHNPHYELHSTADETPPEEAAETPTAPLVEEEGKLGEEMIRSSEIFLLHLVGEKKWTDKNRAQFKNISSYSRRYTS